MYLDLFLVCTIFFILYYIALLEFELIMLTTQRVERCQYENYNTFKFQVKGSLFSLDILIKLKVYFIFSNHKKCTKCWTSVFSSPSMIFGHKE